MATSLRTFRLHVEGDLALQLGQLTHVCEDVSVEATTILLGVEQAEGERGESGRELHTCMGTRVASWAGCGSGRLLLTHIPCGC